MAGRFSNIKYNETVESLTNTMKKVINNNYYKYSDKPPTIVIYFHLNREASTLDEGSELEYRYIGEDSPLRYNRIKDMVIYGLDTPFQIQYANEDFGAESAAIEGEAYILPNTITPYPGDCFIIDHMNRPIVIKVTHVDIDTLEDGSNIYKINYRTSSSDIESLEKQVVEEFSFIVNNVGTNMNPVLKNSTVDFIKTIDENIIALKQYYKRIFYNKRVQTFTFRYLEENFYDPYLIEFLRKNKILEGDGEYIYIQHQTQLEPLFPMEYNKTIFACLEKKDPYHIGGYTHRGVGRLIENPCTIFYNRMEEYWELYYNYPQGLELLHQVPCFKDEFINHVLDEECLETHYLFYNIIIKYLYNNDLTVDDMNVLDTISYENNPTLFYAIPCIIYCLERYLDKLLLVQKVDPKH